MTFTSTKKPRVILIDPWGTANTAEYLNGLIYGLSPITELTVFTNHYFKLKVGASASIHKVFFPKSEKMKRNEYRKILRGWEYILAYRKIFRFLEGRPKYDAIHINWLLFYSLDIRFLQCLKRYTKKIVYTAHNVVPHVNGTRYLTKLGKIYGLCDKIILHGESVKQEFRQYFPEYVDKVYLQKHGCNLQPITAYDETKIASEIKEKIKGFDKIFIFLGNVFYNKGIDRVVKDWSAEWKDTLLIVAGKRGSEYPQLDELADKMRHTVNILWLDGYVEDNLLNYLITHSNLILLPYRHASMSGVVFTAADFSKPVLCTTAGAIKEYIVDGKDGFVVANEDKAIAEEIEFIINNMANQQLQRMGENLHQDIIETCSWDKIMQKVVEECYCER